MSPLGSEMLAVARTQVGVHEVGNNRGARVKVYQDFIGRGVEGQPWCAAFAVWCVYQAAQKLRCAPGVPRVASSQALYEWGRSSGRLLPHPVPGCIGLLRGAGGHEHTFMVEAVVGGGVRSIDGNYSNSVAHGTHPVHSCDFLKV